MKSFFCIMSDRPASPRNRNLKLLKAACEAQGIEFVPIVVRDTALSVDSIPNVGEGGVYLLNITPACYQYVYAFMHKNPHVKNLYLPEISLMTAWGELIRDELSGVPIIPTLFTPPEVVDDELLRQIDEKLDGFPVILKRSEGSHGTGVMIIDSAVSLKTTLPHIIQGASKQFALKKFINKAKHYRIIVLGNEVIGSIIYHPQEGDIRTNAVKEPHVEAIELKEGWKDIAIRSVKQKGVVFGGVDLLEATDGNVYIAEVNTPCNFSRCQLVTGDPIAEKIVTYLCT